MTHYTSNKEEAVPNRRKFLRDIASSTGLLFAAPNLMRAATAGRQPRGAGRRQVVLGGTPSQDR